MTGLHPSELRLQAAGALLRFVRKRAYAVLQLLRSSLQCPPCACMLLRCVAGGLLMSLLLCVLYCCLQLSCVRAARILQRLAPGSFHLCCTVIVDHNRSEAWFVHLW